MTKEQLIKVLNNYLNGTSTPEEDAVIDQWYQQWDNKGSMNDIPDQDHQDLKQKMFREVLNKIDTVPPLGEAPVVRKSIRIPWWLRLTAAAVVLTVLAFYSYYSYTGNKEQPSVAEKKAHDNNLVNTTTHIIKQVLSDSSVVWLSPGATLRFPDVFGATARRVTMSGDCFFEVTKNPARPFIIESNKLITKVWGTSFHVFDNPDSSEAKVTVVTGKVSVSKRKTSGEVIKPALLKEELVLLPKQQAVFNAANNQLTNHTQADMASLAKWNHIDLSFSNTSFFDIVATLQQQFNVVIQLKDKHLGDAKMTADFSGFNLVEVLELLKLTMHISYEIENDQIILSKK
jgi:ferric-dicitrate binding protein FerR (iron transport regulator)